MDPSTIVETAAKAQDLKPLGLAILAIAVMGIICFFAVRKLFNLYQAEQAKTEAVNEKRLQEKDLRILEIAEAQKALLTTQQTIRDLLAQQAQRGVAWDAMNTVVEASGRTLAGLDQKMSALETKLERILERLPGRGG